MQARNAQPLTALFEIGVLFLPAIPAYLWVWPNLSGKSLDVFQIIVYLYILGGTAWIIHRHWSLAQVGVNLRGLAPSLALTALILAGRQLIILSIDWIATPETQTAWQVTGNVAYYFALVGLTEELLFRGLIYTTLESWRGARWAVWGSSLGFLLWHIFGQGIIIGLTTFVIGLAFALFRLRLGGIIGLIILHALWDLQAVLQIGGSNSEILQQLYPKISHPGWLRLGTILMLLPFLYLWLLHPRLERRLKSNPLNPDPGGPLPSG